MSDFTRPGLFNELRSDAMAAGMLDGDSAEIDAALADGKFVAICTHPVYCRVTDAILGEAANFLGAFDTPEEAQSLVAAEEGDGYEDIHFTVLGVTPAPAPAPLALDIPF